MDVKMEPGADKGRVVNRSERSMPGSRCLFSLVAVFVAMCVQTAIAGALPQVSGGWAEAAVYRAERPGMSVSMVTQGGQFVEFSTSYRLRCEDGTSRSVSHFRYRDLDRRMPVDSRTGRFYMRLRDESPAKHIIDIGGRLTDRKITGFLFESRIPLLTINPGCTTVGKSGKGRIRFVAERLSPRAARAWLNRTKTYSARDREVRIFARVRPGLSFFPFQIRYEQRCSNGRTPSSVFSVDGRELRISSRTGRFRERVRILADSLNAEFILQGRVTGRRIVGSVSWSAFIAPGGANTKSYHCWTGRNRNNPEVPFVAARISPPLGQVPRSAGRG